VSTRLVREVALAAIAAEQWLGSRM